MVIFGANFITDHGPHLTAGCFAVHQPSGNTPLTYYWSVAAGNVAGIVGADHGDALGDRRRTDGEYDIEVTVTDSKGNRPPGRPVMLVPNVTTN